MGVEVKDLNDVKMNFSVIKKYTELEEIKFLREKQKKYQLDFEKIEENLNEETRFPVNIEKDWYQEINQDSEEDFEDYDSVDTVNNFNKNYSLL